ncbi:MAG: lysostaphin resistance A-like protein [Bullifex sp.]
MLKKLYGKSEVWFAVMFIIAYVIGNSYLLQASIKAGIEMVFTIPFNLLLLAILFSFIGKNNLAKYYGLNAPECRSSVVLYYIPMILIASVNLWMGFRFKMDAFHSAVYFTAMLITGIIEELLFRGLLFRAMSKDSLKSAVILTSILFGAGHIVNLFNGNSENVIATLCQLFYAAAAGFLFASVLLASKSIIPCMITHSVLNALGTFSNENALDEIQIPISLALCLISGISALMIFRNLKKEKS